MLVTAVHPWCEIRDGAHARSRQALRPVQSIHESSSVRSVSGVDHRLFHGTAKREFGRFVLSAPGGVMATRPGMVEACA